jgi:hypothetical protein
VVVEKEGGSILKGIADCQQLPKIRGNLIELDAPEHSRYVFGVLCPRNPTNLQYHIQLELLSSSILQPVSIRAVYSLRLLGELASWQSHIVLQPLPLQPSSVMMTS